MRAKITSRGRITLPVKLRRKFDLKPGDIIFFDEKAPFIRASKDVDFARMHSTIGWGKKTLQGKTVEQWMEWLRGPVELP